MIFVTVGTQLPFDRFVEIMDEFASRGKQKVVGQIGDGKFIPAHLEWKRFYDPDEMEELYDQAQIVVSHAGMGSIISCLRRKKTIIIFPRLKAYGEHRNDHQLDTVESLQGVQGVYAANTRQELDEMLNNFDSLDTPVGLDCPERKNLIDYLLSNL